MATRLESHAARAPRHPGAPRGGDAGAGAGHRQVGLDGGPQDGPDQGGRARHRRGAAARRPDRGDRVRQRGASRSCACSAPPTASGSWATSRASHASGGTNILSGLREAVDELLPARARKKHIILLSDGQSPYEEIPDLVDAAAAARITISAVGVGDGADQTLLKMIATRGGGRFYHTRDPASIPRIFSRETSELGDRSIVERPTAVRVAKRIAALAGVPLESAPRAGRLRGHPAAPAGRADPGHRATARRCSRAGSWASARWRPGPAISARAGRRRGRAGPPYEKLWAQVARATMRRRAASHFPIRSTRVGDLVRLTVDAVGADDRFMVGLDGSVQVTAVSPGRPGGAAARAAPGRDRARPLRGQLPPRRSTPARCCSRRRCRAGKTPAAAAAGRMTLPFAPELRPHPPAARRRPPRARARRCWPRPPRARAAASISDVRTSSTSSGRPLPETPPSAEHPASCWQPPCFSWSTFLRRVLLGRDRRALHHFSQANEVGPGAVAGAAHDGGSMVRNESRRPDGARPRICVVFTIRPYPGHGEPSIAASEACRPPRRLDDGRARASPWLAPRFSLFGGAAVRRDELSSLRRQPKGGRR